MQPQENTALWACLGRAVNYKDVAPLHHDTLATNAGLFFGAGYESSAHACTRALFEVAANRDIQVRIMHKSCSACLAVLKTQTLSHFLQSSESDTNLKHMISCGSPYTLFLSLHNTQMKC